MTKSNKIIIGILGIFVIVGFVLGVYGFIRGLENPPKFDDAEITSPEAAEFSEKIQNYVVENIGQPIEGFSAPIYLQAFPGLMKADFDNVETAEGKYVYSDNELIFTITQTRHISSVGEMILNNGHKTLLSNLRTRLGNDLTIEEIVDRIIAQERGTVHGTILRGPICPVMKDPPEEECADQPVFGEFIVKDIAGINEITRFSTQRDGSFTITLPVGEYSIESKTPLGLPGIQAHRIEVRANETPEYTIMFDTGIR